MTSRELSFSEEEMARLSLLAERRLISLLYDRRLITRKEMEAYERKSRQDHRGEKKDLSH